MCVRVCVCVCVRVCVCVCVRERERVCDTTELNSMHALGPCMIMKQNCIEYEFEIDSRGVQSAARRTRTCNLKP